MAAVPEQPPQESILYHLPEKDICDSCTWPQFSYSPGTCTQTHFSGPHHLATIADDQSAYTHTTTTLNSSTQRIVSRIDRLN
jgi:hypothetical protein